MTKKQILLFILGLLVLACGPSSQASGCGGRKLDASVRNFMRDGANYYKVSFNVSDGCLDDDEIESITLVYKVKIRTSDGSITEKEQIITDAIYPKKSHTTVITNRQLMLTGENEIVDAYVTSVKFNRP
jgi:hypothetical protein